MPTTLIKNGTIVLAQSAAQRDLLIDGERIAAVGDLTGVTADQTIDAGGLLVLPGGVDTHVHFNDVFMNTISVHDYATGTRAAAFGGTTSVIDFSNQAPGATLMRTLDAKYDEAEGKAIIDWGVHPVITQPTEATLDEIPDVVAAGAPTIKFYMTYRDEGLLIEEPDLRRILARLRDAGGMLLVHAEDNDLAEASIPGFIERGRDGPHLPRREQAAGRRESGHRALHRDGARDGGGRGPALHRAPDHGRGRRHGRRRPVARAWT